jgi:hypothetical protein
VSGTVLGGDDQQSLPGVSVLVKGTSVGTTTGPSGEYALTAPSATLNEVILPEFVGPESNAIRPANTNWYDEISRTGVTQNHKLQVTAGNERGSALLGLRYHDADGIIKETGFRRLSARINEENILLDEPRVHLLLKRET